MANIRKKSVRGRCPKGVGGGGAKLAQSYRKAIDHMAICRKNVSFAPEVYDRTCNLPAVKGAPGAPEIFDTACLRLLPHFPQNKE